ncbi:tripartite tricarboxylate transporter substrate binding protein [Pseudooceanicola sp. 216_PA32_1]|uniref:Tripartite tricarboxylate transporter substrate binding protein n=1 Tax=Pseudooceanicola pacificus TaxID=2676438 RepID=A0A844W0S9_9RHOB|nr:tripartite tricarboxylate transporter substrate binding protein [Pseudooceanicola pacificus]MWB77676.1 tripartite tricarboxylate transporter substrate binding protein [Pseudooceanicola pacificus]
MTFAKGLRSALTGVAIIVTGTLAAGAQDFPGKDITHIMPWSAGGGTDTVMRTFLQYAEKPLGVGVRTQNVTGAQSGVGTLRLMKSRPDGYTIGTLTWDSMITVPYKALVPGYDTSTLSYLANVTLYPTVLAVNADTGWTTLDDFIAAAKAAPGEVTVSDSGIGGIWHLHALDMADQLGVTLNHVPFPNGSAEQREALISGENDAASLSYATVASAAEAGQVKVLAVMGSERDPSLPDVPTFTELGYDVIWGGMRVLAVPADTPQEVKDTLITALKAAFDDPEFQEKAAATGMNAYWMDGEQTEAYVERTQTRALKLLDKLKAEGVLE